MNSAIFKSSSLYLACLAAILRDCVVFAARVARAIVGELRVLADVVLHLLVKDDKFYFKTTYENVEYPNERLRIIKKDSIYFIRELHQHLSGMFTLSNAIAEAGE